MRSSVQLTQIRCIFNRQLREGCGSFFGDKEGEAPLVESVADALIAFKCCIENNRRADFLDWRPHRAAV